MQRLRGAGPAVVLFLGLVLFRPIVIAFADSTAPGAAGPWPPPVVPPALAVIFSGDEYMHFSLSWSGGIKIGDLVLEVKKTRKENFLIRARVTDYGLFKLFYPVDDTFRTWVKEELKLPVRYEVEQEEGHGSAKTRRLTLYDQQGLRVRYRKNDQPWQEFPLSGPVYNEFSSFFITRALDLDRPVKIVPAFVDGKRHQVEVRLVGREEKKTRFGRIPTLKVWPRMSFKGLYDKDGDTVFWLSDDQCRVPVEIDSKIVVGSLVAELVEYKNPACPGWTDRVR